MDKSLKFSTDTQEVRSVLRIWSWFYKSISRITLDKQTKDQRRQINKHDRQISWDKTDTNALFSVLGNDCFEDCHLQEFSCIRWFAQSVRCVEKGCSYKLYGATLRRTMKCPFQTTRKDSGINHFFNEINRKNFTEIHWNEFYKNKLRVDILEKVYHQCGLCGELMLHDK